MVSPISTLLIDGNDIRTDFPGISVYGDLNLFAPGDRKGDDQDIPGRAGVVPVAGLQPDKYTFSILIKLNGPDEGTMIANYLANARLFSGVNDDGLVELTRRLANAANDGYDEYTAPGRLNTGLAMQTLNPLNGRCELQYTNLDGRWLRSSDSHYVIP